MQGKDVLDIVHRHLPVRSDLEAILVLVLGGLLFSVLVAFVALLFRRRSPTGPDDIKTLSRHGFRKVRPIDRGAFAEIYRARSKQGRVVALKILQRGHRSDSDTVRRFMAEASILRRIDRQARDMKLDPRVTPVRCYSYGFLNGPVSPPTPYIELEFIPGVPLSKRIRPQQRIPVAEALQIARQIAYCLIPVHALGIAHRDVSPENVLLEGGDPRRMRLIDFGTAKHDHGHTVDGSVFGKVLYMSPEQCVGKGVDQRSDLYSLGVILFQMLTGSTPFFSQSIVELLDMHRSRQPPRIPAGIAPPGMVQIVDGLLVKDRHQRWPVSAPELVRRLDSFRRTSC